MARHRVLRSIGRYEIRRELGRGTMGVVYEAWDPALGRTIALKTVAALSLSRRERRKYEKRFLTEARAAARVSHPGIVVVHDVGRDSGSGLLFIALEHLDGETLADRVASGRPSDWRDSLRIVGRVAEALHHAHAQGVVHRDVKPANIMILRSGEPKIMDFGIARVDAGHLTTPGELFGTPLYMAPEQALGRPADARSDLFSLGTIAYTLLTGRAPFAAPNVPAILARVAHRSAPPPSELVPGLPPAIDDLLARAMAKAPEDRYPTGRMIAEDIEDVLAGRAPRHRAGWTPTQQGERTFVSAGADGELPELDLVEDAPAPPRRRRRWRSAFERAALLAVAAAAAFQFGLHPEDLAFWLRVGQETYGRLAGPIPTKPPERPPTPTAPATAAAPAAASTPEPGPGATADEVAEGARELPPDVPSPTPPISPVAASPAGPDGSPPAEAPSTLQPAGEPTPTGPAAPAATVPEPTTNRPPTSGSRNTAPTPTPTPAPRPRTEKPASPPTRAPEAAAWLSVGFEHHLASGTLEVFVDGKRVAREALDSHVTRKLLGFELRAGSVQQTLGLEPGQHEVRVRLRSGDDVRTARTSAAFRAGATNRLEIKASRLRASLTLEWK
ncbi:MAG TPA: protein kinase [Vicinamibacteria bacterium]|nr:protein kinase [Vicinamibacteria bacterium]